MNTQKTIIVTSPNSGAGKTTVAGNLSIALSRMGQRVLAVGSNTHKPTLAHFFNLKKTGPFHFQDVLTGRDISDAIVLSDVGVYVLPSRKDPSAIPSLGQLLDLSEVIAKRREYDYVVIDTNSSVFNAMATLGGTYKPLIVLSPKSIPGSEPVGLSKLFQRIDMLHDLLLNKVDDNAHSLFDAEASMIFHGRVITHFPEVPGFGELIGKMPNYIRKPGSTFSMRVQELAEYYIAGADNRRKIAQRHRPRRSRWSDYGGTL